ncbi:MAG: response regulator [Candidatus Avelusimicrobium sp.]|uniref:response regulator n=1 Tax=Candidatus Avelusimicrobium sp. TaxID=3048833 RepID=UPI003F0E28EA
MKKTILVVLALISAWPCAAQKNPFKWWKSLRAAPARAATVPSSRVVQGKFLPSPGHVVIPSWQIELERYVARTAVPTKLTALSYTPRPISPEMKEVFGSRYSNTMGLFEKFKKETSPFLYYQIKPSERRRVEPIQKAELLPKVIEMEKSLVLLAAVVNVQEDEALSFALDYTARVRDELMPELKGLSGIDLYFSRSDRKFVGDEFYLLHETQSPRRPSLFRRGSSSRQPAKLPANLRIAVLNDSQSVLEQMWILHRKGAFINGGKLFCFTRADEVLASVRAGTNYDLILTDIIVPGGGGYYLVHQLRKDGFSGAVIALSAYERDDSMGLDMFKRGFDGMFTLPTGFEYAPSWPSDIERGLNKYFALRARYGWRR